MVFMACGAWAQETYYYCGGKKVFLNSFKSKSAFNSIVGAYTNTNGDYLELTGSIYVKLKSLSDKNLLPKVLEEYDLTLAEQNRFLPLWFVLHSQKQGKTIIETANRIFEKGIFAECYPDFSMLGVELSFDPFVCKQWSMHNAQFPCVDAKISEAWNYSTGRNVVIAIVDEGIDMFHKDLAQNIYERSYDAASDTEPSTIYVSSKDTNGNHGTHCAGIAAAVRNNGFGIVGVAPDAKLMSISDKLGVGEEADFSHARGIMWAWQHGADVISCSWKCYNIRGIVTDAINEALSNGRNGKGCIVVKSAGNGNGYITEPGNVPGVIAVGNIMQNGEINPESCHGKNLLVCAPGTNILSLKFGNDTVTWSGTSMAAPYVSGVVALMLERNPELTSKQVREILAKTAIRLPSMPIGKKDELGVWDEHYGYGLVNALGAVLEAIKYKQ